MFLTLTLKQQTNKHAQPATSQPGAPPSRARNNRVKSPSDGGSQEKDSLSVDTDLNPPAPIE